MSLTSAASSAASTTSVVSLSSASSTTTARKTILKTPGSKSPIHKKVEFVNDSEEDSLSEPDFDDEDEDDFYDRSKSNKTTKPTKPAKPVKAVKAKPQPKKSIKQVPQVAKDSEDEDMEPVTELEPDESVALIIPHVSEPVLATPVSPTTPLPTLTPTSVVKLVPRVTKVELDEDEEEEEEDEDNYDEDGDNSGGSDYDSEGGSIKRQKTGRVTHQMIKASIPKTTTRVSRSGRAPLQQIKLTISSKPLLTSKPTQPSGKSLATLGKKFKVPTFTVPGMAPDPGARPMALTLGVKKRLAVEGRSAHDYTMEGSIILYDPAWAQLDEAQKEEERLMSASQEQKEGEEDETPQVIIPKKEKARSKSIAEMLGLTKQKEVPKVHVVVSGASYFFGGIDVDGESVDFGTYRIKFVHF